VVGGYQAFKRLRHPEQRRAFAQWLDRQTQRPLLRPLGWLGRSLWVVIGPLWRYVLRPLWTLIAPPLRFVGARLTPGELGIELTTLLAIAGVAVYTVILQINLLETDALLLGDETALEIARDIEVGILTTIGKVLAVVGRLWFVVLVTAAVCGYLLSRRRAAEAIALSAGLAITQITTQIIKGAVDRPRPGDGLVDADGFAYPSGHASIAITYLAIAVVLSRTVPAAWRVVLVVAGAVLAVAIGLSRVYLRVHYLTDVAGGWAVGLAVFSLCGAVALVVDYLRQDREARRAQDGRLRPPAAGMPSPPTAGGAVHKIVPEDE
jgi:undecaprenyl-diphosphatase